MGEVQVYFEIAPGSRDIENVEELHEICSLLSDAPDLIRELYPVFKECETKEEIFKEYLVKRIAEFSSNNEEEDIISSNKFWKIFELIAELYRFHETNIYDLGRLKGKLLELYLWKLLDNEYDSESCETQIRHFVIINGRRSAREIDVLAWKKEANKGEFFECKFSLDSTASYELKQYIDNLRQIRNRIKGSCKSSYVYMGFATFQDTDEAKEYLKIFVGNIDDLLILGGDKLHALYFRQRLN